MRDQPFLRFCGIRTALDVFGKPILADVAFPDKNRKLLFQAFNSGMQISVWLDDNTKESYSATSTDAWLIAVEYSGTVIGNIGVWGNEPGESERNTVEAIRYWLSEDITEALFDQNGDGGALGLLFGAK